VSGTRALAAEGTPRVRVVVDTNLLVSGVISAAGLPRQLLNAGQPGGQGSAVTPKAAELARVALHRAVGLLDQDSHHMQHAVHTSMPATHRYQARNPRSSMTMLLSLKRQVAHRAITVSAECKTPSSEGWKTPRIELDSGLFTVRAATRPRQMGRAARQSGFEPARCRSA
jgi:hypothetical protein